ncbi:MAG: TonB-dependent receptor plug domain-containing protein, partial [Thermodesulfovibrio sp.]|nr:TonB-dependent receptor plug domain-containing protein [Thermodesulfovibrio sp.]
MHVFIILIILLFLTILTEKSNGQTYELPTLEVVSSPIVEEIKLNNRANQITVVTEKQIESMNALDIASALRRVPGINISRFNLVGSYGGAEGGSIFIRGMGAERPGAEIMTLIDGRPVFQGIFTHPLLDLLSVDIAERIEIYKTPQPVKFGNMSFGAVNIITKRKKEEGFETKLGITYGEHNTFIGYTGHGGKIKDWDYFIIGGYKRSEGHRDDADGQLESYFVRLSKEFNKSWDFTLTGLFSDNWGDDPGRINSPKGPVTPRFKSRSLAF